MKLNTAAVLRLAMPLLSASRKVRDMVEQLLIEKRMLEDAVKVKGGEVGE